MYPRLKVRAQEQPVAIRDMESLSPESHFKPKILVLKHESGYKNDSHPQRARTLIPHLKNPLTPPISASKGKDDKELDEDKKTNIRASSLPRPRAVLSSPDNDGTVGCQNRRMERRTPLRRQIIVRNNVTAQESQVTREKRAISKTQASTLAQHNTDRHNVGGESPKSTRKVLKEAGNKSTQKQKHSSYQRPPFTL